MTQVTVDNNPISIHLDPGQSTTVPSGEVWKVQITLCIIDGNNNNNDAGGITINGTTVIGAVTGGDHQGVVTPETVLTSGDTVKLNSGIGASITGFVIN